jgi:hypothetical protein
VPRLYDHVLLSTWSHLLQPPCNLSMAIAWFTVVAPCLLPLPPQTGMLTRSCLLVTEFALKPPSLDSLLSACLGSLADESGSNGPCVTSVEGPLRLPCPQPPIMLNHHHRMTSKAVPNSRLSRFCIREASTRHHVSAMTCEPPIRAVARLCDQSPANREVLNCVISLDLQHQGVKRWPSPTERSSSHSDRNAPSHVKGNHHGSLTSKSRQRRI